MPSSVRTLLPECRTRTRGGMVAEGGSPGPLRALRPGV